MDEKFGWTAALLVGTLILASALGYMGGMAANDTADNTDENEDEQQEMVVTDAAPLLTMDEAVHAYGVTAFTVEGGIHDENPSTTVVYVEIINPVDETERQGPWMFFAGSDGRWTGVLPITVPGEWVTSAYAEDAGGLTSGTIYSTAIMPLPDEPSAVLTTAFALNSVNNDWADITGTISHTFPSTCTVSYQPQGQEALPGQVMASTFSIPLDYNTTNHAGEIIADCGLFTNSRTVIQYAIPELYTEEPDADQDGIPDAEDDCDNTPQGEPVYSDGCSDSERDDDGDGVSNTDDECEGHDDSIDVDNDGIVDGCDSLIDSDGDGVADADDVCEGGDDNQDADTDGIPDACDNDDDNDGVADGPDQCPNTAPGTEVDATGCPLITWEPQDSWVCTDQQGPWVKDFNGDGNTYQSNTNGVNSANGGGSGPWFQCQVSVTIQNGEMVVESNAIPNHDFLSTMGCCAPEKDFTSYITLNPVNDTSGGHTTTNCPASAGRWECAPDRGAVAIGVNGVPIFGPEEGPGGDAVALHFDYFDEDRQPIFLGWCAGHSAGNGGYHYHYDANCIYWEPGMGEDMEDYDLSKIPTDTHSPIVGWAFDGYPIYGMYGYDAQDGSIRAITSSYTVERTQDGGDQGYNGIDDWNYVNGIGDLDECNGRFGPTPEYPEGIYHYVSTPLSGSPTLVTDTNGQQVGMIGFPYFLLCYHGIADVDGQDLGGGQGGPPGGGGGGGPPGQSDTTYGYGFMPENIDPEPPMAGLSLAPSLMEIAQGLLFFAVIIASSLKLKINGRGSTYTVAS